MAYALDYMVGFGLGLAWRWRWWIVGGLILRAVL
jgi:hypothetical protein